MSRNARGWYPVPRMGGKWFPISGMAGGWVSIISPSLVGSQHQTLQMRSPGRARLLGEICLATRKFYKLKNVRLGETWKPWQWIAILEISFVELSFCLVITLGLNCSWVKVLWFYLLLLHFFSGPIQSDSQMWVKITTCLASNMKIGRVETKFVKKL